MYSEYKNLQIQCPIHQNNYLTHACNHSSCIGKNLKCSQCFIDDIEHLTLHKAFIVNIPDYFQQVGQQLIQIENEKQEEFEIPYQVFEQIFDEQQEQIRTQLNIVCQRFCQMIENQKMMVLDDIEISCNIVKSHYNAFHQGSQLNIQSHQQFIENLSKQNPNNIQQYLTYVMTGNNEMKYRHDQAQKKLRKFIGSFEQIEFDIIPYFNEQIQILQNQLKMILHNNVKLFHDIEDQNEENVQTSSALYKQELLNENKDKQSSEPHLLEQNTTPQRQQKDTTSSTPFLKYESQINAVNQNSQKIDPFKGQHLISKEITSMQLKIHQSNFDYLSDSKQATIFSQKNMELITNQRFDADNLNFQLQPQTYIQNDDQLNTAICMLRITQQIVVVAGKDFFIKIFKIDHNLKLNLLALNLKTGQAVWCMQNIFSLNLLAVGTENGKILFFDIQDILQNQSSQMLLEPAFELQIQDEQETITALLEVPYTNLLITGDRKGYLNLWNLQLKEFITRYKTHEAQINSITLYGNNGIAVGSYDGILSFWQIMDKNQQKGIQCIKVTNLNLQIYSLSQVKSTPHIVITDSSKTCSLFNVENMKFENKKFEFTHPILDVLTVQYQDQDELLHPVLLCFTKNQLLVVNYDTMQLFRKFQFQNNIGYTMSSCYKVVFTKNIDQGSSLQFLLLEQSNKINKIISTFSLSIF